MDAVAVFETTDMLELERAKSILDQYQIVWFVKNEHSQNTLSSLGMIAGYDPLAGAYQIMVSEKDADKALEALGSIFPEFNEEENHKDSKDKNEIPIETEFEEDEEDTRSDQAKEQRADMVKLLILSMNSFCIFPALFTIPYYIRLQGKYKLQFVQCR